MSGSPILVARVFEGGKGDDGEVLGVICCKKRSGFGTCTNHGGCRKPEALSQVPQKELACFREHDKVIYGEQGLLSAIE